MASSEEESLRADARGSARLADGETLARNVNQQSDSGYLLELLGFEILLKAAHLVHVEKPKRSHSY